MFGKNEFVGTKISYLKVIAFSMISFFVMWILLISNYIVFNFPTSFLFASPTSLVGESVGGFVLTLGVVMLVLELQKKITFFTPIYMGAVRWGAIGAIALLKTLPFMAKWAEGITSQELYFGVYQSMMFWELVIMIFSYGFVMYLWWYLSGGKKKKIWWR